MLQLHRWAAGEIRTQQTLAAAQLGGSNYYRPLFDVGWCLRSGEAHLLRYGSTGRGNATRSPVPRSIRCRRAGTRTCLPTAPSAAAPAGVGWGRKSHTVAAVAVAAPQSHGHSARRRARSGVLDAGESAANQWKQILINR